VAASLVVLHVHLLPCVHGEVGRGLLVHDLVRVLDLRGRRGGRIGVNLLDLLLLLLLLGLLLLGLGGRALGEHLLLAQRALADDGLELGLVHAGVEPAHNVAEGLEEVLVHDELHGVHEGGNDADVGEGDLERERREEKEGVSHKERDR